MRGCTELPFGGLLIEFLVASLSVRPAVYPAAPTLILELSVRQFSAFSEGAILTTTLPPSALLASTGVGRKFTTFKV
jgi:hypothetical protein